MAKVRYSRANAPVGKRFVSYTGGTFDVVMQLASGSFTVDDSVYPDLVAALDQEPGVQRSGGGGATGGGAGTTTGPQGPPGNTELGYAQITSGFSSGVTAATDVPGLAITVDERQANGRPYTVEAFSFQLAGSVAGQYVYIQIVDVASGNVIALASYYPETVINTGAQVLAKARIPATGSPNSARQFKVQTLAGGTSHPILNAAVTGPAYIQANVV